MILRRGDTPARFRGAARVKPIGERSRAVPFLVPLVNSYPLVSGKILPRRYEDPR